MVAFQSAEIYKNVNGRTYVLCIFDKGKYNNGFHLQWVRANKVGYDEQAI